MKTAPTVGDFVAKKIYGTDWVITGTIVEEFPLQLNNEVYKILWTPDPRFPVSKQDFYESWEDLEKSKIIVMRSEKDIPVDFLPPS